MFGKRKAAKKREQEVAELFALQEQYTKQIDAQFASLEEVKDPAEKILKIQKLAIDIRNADYQAYSKQARIAQRRAHKKMAINAGAGAVTTAAAVAIPTVILFPPAAVMAIPAALLGTYPAIFTEIGMREKKRKQLLEQNPKLNDFAKVMEAQEARASELLAEITKTCDLKEVSLSPSFKQAFGSTPLLRNRFADAAAKAAKEEFEEKTALEQQTAPQRPKPPPSYDNLKGL